MSILSEKDSSYHHGDLRNALIKAGLEQLNDVGVDGLSLRKLARQVGVSHNAPYMHFKDKEGLLAVIAREGFKLLQEQVHMIMSNDSSWNDRFSAVSHTYVQFALTHPAHMSVMFRDYDSNIYPETDQATEEAFELLNTLMVEGQTQGAVRSGDSHQQAALVWSLLHGIATILTADKMPTVVTKQLETDGLINTFIEQLYTGIKKEV